MDAPTAAGFFSVFMVDRLVNSMLAEQSAEDTAQCLERVEFREDRAQRCHQIILAIRSIGS